MRGRFDIVIMKYPADEEDRNPRQSLAIWTIADAESKLGAIKLDTTPDRLIVMRTEQECYMNTAMQARRVDGTLSLRTIEAVT